MKKLYQVVIPQTAKESLRSIVNHIKKDSPIAAHKVRRELLQLARSLSELPERFSKEEYLLEKSGNYRSITRWHYKIVYKIEEDEVVILRFIHTKQNPDLINKLG
jgi:plasmid stabilization system protein ParE